MQADTRAQSLLAVGFVCGIAVAYAISVVGPPLGQWTRNVITTDETSAADECAEDIREGIEGCVGSTPLFRIKSLSEATGVDILGKAEFLNGAGQSPKDRVALNVINTAEEKGLIAPHRGDTIYEGTVGSTGISLAALCHARGYRAHICHPTDTSPEKLSLLSLLGATLSPSPPQPISSPLHYVNRARTLASRHPNALFSNQFENPANHVAHYSGTGREIHLQTAGRIDAFVAGAGTGGTISGAGAYLKQHSRRTSESTKASNGERIERPLVIVADPQGSGLYNLVRHGTMYSPSEREGTRPRHAVDSLVEGVGSNRQTANFMAGLRPTTTGAAPSSEVEAAETIIDDAVRVTDAQALSMARWLVRHDGLFVGGSSAVNCVGAVVVARRLVGEKKSSSEALEGPRRRVVTVICDGGHRSLGRFWKAVGPVSEVEAAGGKGTLDEVLAGTYQ